MQCGRAQLVTARVIAKVEMIDVEIELMACAKPAGSLRNQPRHELGADVEVSEPGPAQQPFEWAGHVYVHVAFGQIGRNLTNTLIGVDQKESAMVMRNV